MKIKWYGHSCFLIEHEDFKIITDPFDNCVNYTLPDIKPDIITVSHFHGDHADPDFLKRAQVIDMKNTIFENKYVKIKGYINHHDDCSGKERGLNTVFIFTFSNGLKIIHLGDTGNTQIEKDLIIEKPDIMLAPFGGVYTIDGYQSRILAKNSDCKILIPMHFKTEKIDFDLKKISDYDMEFIKKEDLVINSKQDLPSKLTNILLDYN